MRGWENVSIGPFIDSSFHILYHLEIDGEHSNSSLKKRLDLVEHPQTQQLLVVLEPLRS